MLTNKLTT